MLVNGKAWPILHLPAYGDYRLRILNACDSRFLTIKIYSTTETEVFDVATSALKALRCLGGDSDWANHPFRVTDLELGPGARADCMPTLKAGENVTFVNTFDDENSAPDTNGTYFITKLSVSHAATQCATWNSIVCNATSMSDLGAGECRVTADGLDVSLRQRVKWLQHRSLAYGSQASVWRGLEQEVHKRLVSGACHLKVPRAFDL
jgi:hypothetical protein